MASAVELFNSREGDSSGVFGDVGVTRVFKVTNDSNDDDPKATLRNLRPGGVPIGQLHPDSGRNGIVALMHTRGRRWDRAVWTVIVHYGPPVFFPTQQSYWEIAFRGSGEQEFVFHDLDGLPIGTPRYVPIEPNTSPANLSPIYTTSIVDENGVTVDQSLYLPHWDKPERQHYYLEGEMRFRQGGEVIFQRNFATFPSAIDTVLAAGNAVNNDKIRVRIADFAKDITLGPPRQFMLRNADCQPMPGVLVGQVVPNRIWRVTIQMHYSVIPFNPLRQRHMYRADDGTESAIMLGGQPVESERRMSNEANFTKLLKLFK